ncbi:hypothetical protein SAMN05421879_10770 [Ornithinimicrobium cerasi]|uniref:Uncharacterized protein n=1 Tax=Ornithinimicrobium cerasi TaxID=2248773 RepID=A0A285VUH9_9MICO|nr:hypothetical protein SAMN05421879_10770 [Ornithinimicrobium cerasi]
MQVGRTRAPVVTGQISGSARHPLCVPGGPIRHPVP